MDRITIPAKDVGITLKISEKTLELIKQESIAKGFCLHGYPVGCPYCSHVWC